MIDESGGRDPAFPGIFQRAVRAGFIGILLVVLGGIPTVGPAQGSEIDPTAAGDTMLMFVGEDLEVLTIASRREESAWQAPAIAQVLTREELRSSGVRTLAGALDRTPGFHMAEKEWGVLPYLRGIPNGALVLYDTVPMVSDTSKSLNQLGHGTSLAPVKRIEIIRGPGSVLWGPDAFAGIVNVVPMTGRDLSGVETGIIYEGPETARGAYVNMGGAKGRWDGFVSASGRWEESADEEVNLARFWKGDGTGYPYEERFGLEKTGPERYLDAFGRVGYGDTLTLSGRILESRDPYGITRSEGDLTWREKRRIPTGFVKLETRLELDRASAVRFMGHYTWLEPEFEIIDKVYEQAENTAYLEGIYDRTTVGKSGLFTCGYSYREKSIRDALFWSGSLPTFLGPENISAVPLVEAKSYRSRLNSLFGQYRQKVGEMDFWGGLRYDSFASNDDRFSYSAGITWSPNERWVGKVLYGTAYRTPYTQQLFQAEDPEMENIDTMTAQISWKPAVETQITLTGFRSRIHNHVVHHPYAGTEFSLPNEQTFFGVETAASIVLWNLLKLESNLTYFENYGPSERYHYNDYDYIREDGSIVSHFTDRKYPFDTGTRLQWNGVIDWKIADRMRLSCGLKYLASRVLIDAREGASHELGDLLLVDTMIEIKELGVKGLDLSVMIANMTDEDYMTPGTYVMIPGDPISFRAMARMHW